MIAIMAILAFAIYFFLGVKFDMLEISKIAIAAISLACFLFVYFKKGMYSFSVFMFTGIFMFLCLTVCFSKPYTGDSPLVLNIVLSPWIIFILSFIISSLILLFYEKIKIKDKYALTLFIVFVLSIIILSFNAKYFDDWKLENYLTLPFIVLLYISHRWFKFSNISYSMIFVFMMLHLIGAHYTYSEVPFGYWLSNVLGLDRNHYDRIVHFGFGLLFAYPIREVSKRISKLNGLWAYLSPIFIVLAFSVVYELIEWGSVVVYGGDLGIAYLGTQGDVWDAQKDMAVAGLGSIVSMLVTMVIIMSLNFKSFWIEFKDSLRVKDKEVLGEVALKKLLKK